MKAVLLCLAGKRGGVHEVGRDQRTRVDGVVYHYVVCHRHHYMYISSSNLNRTVETSARKSLHITSRLHVKEVVELKDRGYYYEAYTHPRLTYSRRDRYSTHIHVSHSKHTIASLG